ncbi:MAG: hypothetical protein M3220_09100, partial [Chloroflexota bacterium]|nr:hypothetical protein [Chloroflexota bacterium]
GLLIDVADYKHVHHGPGVSLVGHEGDYAIDMGDGRPGLLYRRKREWDDDPSLDPSQTLQQRLRTVFRLALRACQVIEAERALGGQIMFRTDEVELTFSDRLRTPNAPETLDALRGTIESMLAELYPDIDVAVERISEDPRRPLALRIHAPGAPSLATLLGTISDRAAVGITT